MFVTTTELVQLLKSINIYASPDGTFNPDSQTTTQILSDFGDALADNEQISKILNFKLPPDYCQEQFKFLKLLGQTNYLASKLLGESFALRDLLEPSDLKKFKNFFFLCAKYYLWRKSEKEKGQNLIDKMLQMESHIE
jgi:hypothetical protein